MTTINVYKDPLQNEIELRGILYYSNEYVIKNFLKSQDNPDYTRTFTIDYPSGFSFRVVIDKEMVKVGSEGFYTVRSEELLFFGEKIQSVTEASFDLNYLNLFRYLLGEIKLDFYQGFDNQVYLYPKVSSTLFLRTGNDTVFGNNGLDDIYGGEGNDVLYGGSGDDRLYGNEGNDLIFGGEGEDYILGDIGDDLLAGGDGNDTIVDGPGNDIISGGSGNDLLKLNGPRSSYKFEFFNNSVEYSNYTDGKNSLYDVEFVYFSDSYTNIPINQLNPAVPSVSLKWIGQTGRLDTLVGTYNIMNEGSAALIEISSKNMSAGTTIPYIIEGVSKLDVFSGTLTGSITLSTSGSANLSIPFSYLPSYAGEKKVTLKILDNTLEFYVLDTDSQYVSTGTNELFGYVQNPSQSPRTVNEGELASVSVKFLGKSLPSYSVLPFNIPTRSLGFDGVREDFTNAFDFDLDNNYFIVSDDGKYIQGVAKFDGSGLAKIEIPVSRDFRTEGVERFQIFTSIEPPVVYQIIDVSRETERPSRTLKLSSTKNSFKESEVIDVQFDTNGYSPGEVISYAIEGISEKDLQDSKLTGSVVVGSFGKAGLKLKLTEDGITEGTEQLRLNVLGESITFDIIDSSVGLLPFFHISSSKSTIEEGSDAIFDVATLNVPLGTSIAYTVTGVSETDIVSGKLSGNFIITEYGRAKISITLSADNSTEGDETMKIAIAGKEASVVIKDTSIGAPAIRTSKLTVLVDKGVLGVSPVLLKDLVEEITTSGSRTISHTVTYNGTEFNYSAIDPLISVILRDGNFSEEFRKEISDLAPNLKDISYSDALTLVGIANIDAQIIAVAGADGNFVG